MAPQIQGGMPPPEGIIPNFDNPDKNLWTLNIITQALVLAIVGAAVILRLYTRIYITMQFGLDDWTCLLGWLFALGYSGIALTMSRFGAGIHQWEVPHELVRHYLKTVYAAMVIYGPCALCIKSSILLFMARVFAPHRETVKATRVAIGVMVVYYFPVTLLKMLICRPIQTFWDHSSSGQCFNQRNLILADAVISVLSDFLILLLPLPMARKLQMERKRKLRIAAVFSIGGFACITSLIRLVDIIQNGASQDQTYVFMHINLWKIAEVNIGLIAACVPLLPAFFKHFSKSSSRQTGYSNYSSSDKAFELSTATQKRRTGGMDKLRPDTVSDENVLIEDIANPIGIHSSIHAASVNSTEEPGIMKTVEVRQTIGKADS